MLIEFRVENHRSIREEQAISFEAAGAADARVRQVPGHAKGLLPALGIYGANASGKSNVLSALAFMRDAVLHSQAHWLPGGVIQRVPFAWGEAKPSLFELTFLHNEVRYQYGFVADDAVILEEWLYAWPRGRKQTWLVREGAQFRFGDQLEGVPAKIQTFGRPNALFLSTAAQMGHAQLSAVFDQFRQMEMRNRRMPFFSGSWLTLTLDAVVYAKLARETAADVDVALLRELMTVADLGLTDVRLPSKEAGLEFEHAGRHWLPVEEESHGTQTLISLANALARALRSGGLLVVDELEAGLHPAISLFLLRQFNDPQTNPKNAQLLFTTHDTHLLGTTLGDPPLRRDQVWLTEKDPEGATHLYPLTDFQPRKAENLERGYLQGRYGAIPVLGELPAPAQAP